MLPPGNWSLRQSPAEERITAYFRRAQPTGPNVDGTRRQPSPILLTVALRGDWGSQPVSAHPASSPPHTVYVRETQRAQLIDRRRQESPTCLTVVLSREWGSKPVHAHPVSASLPQETTPTCVASLCATQTNALKTEHS